MTALEERFVTEARRLLGTRFVHQGRLPGVGLDCIGVLVCAARAAGARIEDRPVYGRRPNARALVDELARQLDPVPLEQLRPGLVVAFYWRRNTRREPLPQHVGVVTPRPGAPGGLGLLHAPAGERVVEVDLDETWAERLDSAWALRGE